MTATAYGATSPVYHATVTMDKNNNAEVRIIEKNKGSVREVQEYMIRKTTLPEVVESIADETNVSYGKAVKFTEVKYPRMKFEKNASKDIKVTNRISKGMVVMNVTRDGTTKEYWFSKSNIKEASDKIARIYRLSNKTVWESVKANRAN